MARLGLLRVFLSSTGSAAPPALLEAGFPHLDLGAFPEGSEELALPAKPGVLLRGVFVPADEGAPVVLHLLESEGSITHGTEDLFGMPCLVELRDLGFASVAVDYRGIGASDGFRSPRNVPKDALCAWEEALARAGGNAKRVVLRASSFGTLAAASLLKRGIEPAAVFLVAPVRAETIVRHWARRYYPWVVAYFGTLFAKKPVKVDIVRKLERACCPLLVYAPEHDYALPDAERVMMQRAVATAGGRWVATRHGHPACVLDAHHVVAEEIELLQRLFPEVPPVPSRLARYQQASGAGLSADLLGRIASRFLLEPAALAAALARNGLSEAAQRGLVEWARSLPAGTLDGLPQDALEILLSPDAEDGSRAWIEDLQSLSRYLEECRGGESWDVASVLELARELGVNGAESSHWRLEHLFRAAGLPVRGSAEGARQVFFDGGWQTVQES